LPGFSIAEAVRCCLLAMTAEGLDRLIGRLSAKPTHHQCCFGSRIEPESAWPAMGAKQQLCQPSVAQEKIRMRTRRPRGEDPTGFGASLRWRRRVNVQPALP
jgi:hypothetical protein